MQGTLNYPKLLIENARKPSLILSYWDYEEIFRLRESAVLFFIEI